MTTGIKRDNLTEVVQQIGALDFHGTLLDDGWFKHLRFDSGKTHMLAVLILSEIVYWFRPTVVKDEETGDIIEIKKKFKADKLQKSYDTLGERFGVSKRMAQEACYFLKEKNLITIEQRTVDWKGGKKLGNVTFFEPIVENIKKISCMCNEYVDPLTFKCDSPPLTSECDTPLTLESDSPITLESDTPLTSECETLHRLQVPETTVSTEITSPKNTSQSVSRSEEPEEIKDGQTDGLKEKEDIETLISNIDWEYLEQQGVPLEFITDAKRIIEHMWYRNIYVTNGSSLPQKVIRKTLRQLNHYCLEFAFSKYDEYTRKVDIKAAQPYLEAVVFNSVYEGTAMLSHRNYNVFGNGREKN